MTVVAFIAGFVLGSIVGVAMQRRSEAENDAHMSAEIVRLGNAIAEALKPEMD